MKNCVLFLILLFSSSLFAEETIQIPDSSWARIKILSEDQKSFDSAKKVFRNKVLVGNELSNKIKLSENKLGSDLYETWFIVENSEGFKTSNLGTIVITRSIKKGVLKNIKLMLPSDGTNYLLIEPKGNDEVYITLKIKSMEKSPYNNMRFAIPIVSFLQMPTMRIIELTQSRIPYADFVWMKPKGAKTFAKTTYDDLIFALKGLKIPDYTMVDSEGEFSEFKGKGLSSASIRDAAYVAFLMQGFLDKAKLGRLEPAELRDRDFEIRGNEKTRVFEEDFNPYFTLDFTRNIARHFPDPDSPEMSAEHHDLRMVKGFNYIEDFGYRISDLRSILYLRAVEESSFVYMIAIASPFKANREIYVYNQALLALPHIDEKGKFNPGLIGAGKSIDLDNFIKSLPADSFAHIIAIPLNSGFMRPYLEY